MAELQNCTIDLKSKLNTYQQMQLKKFNGYLKDSWIKLLQYELLTLDIVKLRELYKEKTCYPAADKIFEPFNRFEVEELKVIIIGQD